MEEGGSRGREPRRNRRTAEEKQPLLDGGRKTASVRGGMQGKMAKEGKLKLKEMRNVFVTGEAQNSQCFWEVPSVLGNSQGFREFPGSQVLLSTSYFQVKPLPSFFLGSERNL